MSEVITRHRGGGYDDDDNAIPWADSAMSVDAVAPGATDEYRERGRNGDAVQFSLYNVPEIDVINGDEVTVRGRRFQVQVEQWVHPRTGRKGTVVLCTSGVG